jgi:uncharacterized protein YcnI
MKPKIFFLTLLCSIMLSSIVSAHVTVSPKASTAGAWETYTIKVPVEKDVPTTKITIKSPTGLEIMSHQPIPGWKYSDEKDSDGIVKSITFEATSGGITHGQFQQFYIVGKNPDKVKNLEWNAYQYYSDGTIAEWTGEAGSDTPHSITQINASLTEGHGMKKQNDAQKEIKETGNENDNDNENLPVIMSTVSVILSILALVMALRRKNS